MRVRHWQAAAATLILSCLAVPPHFAAADDSDDSVFRPVYAQRFADPAVVPYDGGYVAVSTGNKSPRATAPELQGPWTTAPAALVTLPGWATSDNIWGPDIQQIGGRWVLYYSATVDGLDAGGRCIGVAVASGPLDPFVPLGDRPLVCPGRADTLRAPDPVKRPRWMPRSGVIDPSVFRDDDGRLYLLYKTDGQPSSIRMVRLRPNGTGVPRKAKSLPLLVSRGIIENPVVVRRAGRYVLFTSERSYATCSYGIEWRRTRDLWNWSRSEPSSFLRDYSTGLCGPGGADVVLEPDRTTMFLHAWVCGPAQDPCPPGFNAGSNPFPSPSRRNLYAVTMQWSGSIPMPYTFATPPEVPVP